MPNWWRGMQNPYSAANHRHNLLLLTHRQKLTILPTEGSVLPLHFPLLLCF